MAYPEPLEELIEAFGRFPGIGRRTAERLSFHILRDAEARNLAPAIQRAVDQTRRCGSCRNVAESELCAICADESRAQDVILVVEEPRDVEAVERAGAWKGVYHVLMGSFNPAEGTQAGHLTIAGLLQRLRGGEVREVILGTDPDAEGEATALLVLESIDKAGLDLRVSRLARGMPAGSALEYLHRGVIEDALEARISLRLPK